MHRISLTVGLFLTLGSLSSGCAEPDGTEDESATETDTDALPMLEGPEFDGQLEVEQWSWFESEQGIAFAVAGTEPQHLCIYDVGHLDDPSTDDGMPRLATELDIPPRQIVHTDRDEYPDWLMAWAAAECPDVLSDESDVWVADVRPGQSAFIGMPAEDATLVAVSETPATGYIFNFSSTELTACFRGTDGTGMSGAAFSLQSGWGADVSDIGDAALDSSWLVPSVEFGSCDTHNRWLEDGATLQLFFALEGNEAEEVHALVLFDPA